MKLNILGIAVLALGLSGSVKAAEQCFELSRDGVAFSRSPELLCVDEFRKDRGIAGTLTLKTDLLVKEKVVATLNLDLLGRVRCLDCNEDTWGVLSPSNSLLNQLQVKFDGKRDRAGVETGTVSIGKTKFHYKSAR